jgi:hypothetical protein
MGLQLRPRIGDPDPSRAGRAILGTDLANGRVRSSVAPDHIVSLAEIVTLPGFAQLTPENMLLVANAPANLQWLSWETNLAKSSRSARYLVGVDPTWQRRKAGSRTESAPCSSRPSTSFCAARDDTPMTSTHEPDLADSDELLADWELQAVEEDQMPAPWRVLTSTLMMCDAGPHR